MHQSLFQLCMRGKNFESTLVNKLHDFIECETRSVTPTSELADKQIDIDEEFASVGIKKFTTTTKTQRFTTTVQKRA